MKNERKIIVYKHHFSEFIRSITPEEARKIAYVLDMLRIRQQVSQKFVKLIRDGLYELRTEYNGNIFRLFFIFDDGNIVVLFNGFQKKTQKTPTSEINKALKLKTEYYATKRDQ